MITTSGPFSTNEGTTPVATLAATDADTAQADLTWSIPAGTDGGADAASFTLSEAGVLAFAAAKDYETPDDADADRIYEVTVQVSDGTDTDTAALEVTVLNVTELTAITGPANVTFPENGWGRVATFTASSEADRDGIEWLLAGDDAGRFRIDSPPGALRFNIAPVAPHIFAQPPDFEALADDDSDNEYSITLLAKAGSDISDTAFAVAVTVADVDEDGSISLSAPRPALGSALVALLTDADGVTGSADWMWERSAGRNDWVTIEGATSAAYTPVAADTGEFLRVTATYADEHGAGKTVSEVAADVVRGPLLTGLTAETQDSLATPAQALFPAFDAQVLHYGIGCNTTDTMTVNVSGPAGGRVSVDGVRAASGTAVDVAVTESSDVRLTVADTSGARTTYTVHCMVDDLFEVETHTYPSATDVTADLFLFLYDNHLVAMDRNGVTRVRRKANEVSPFPARFTRVGDDGAYRYAHDHVKNGRRYLILDEDLEVIDDNVRTVSPLTNLDYHDFRVLPNSNYLLMAYEPARRDLRPLDLPFPAGENFSSVQVWDSAIQIVTPQDRAVFTWNSWDHMVIEDCVQHRFPVAFPNLPSGIQQHPGYAHINGLDYADGVVLGSFRGCSKVLAIDTETEDVKWRIGQSNFSSEEWADFDLGPAPLDLIGDPEGEFCGQHTAQFLPNGNIFLYDNGRSCVINHLTFEPLGRAGEDFSRAVEYALDLDNDEAVFVRDHSLRGDRTHFAIASGSVVNLDNGDWLISWGRNRSMYLPDREAATLVDPATGQEKMAIRFDETLPDNLTRFPFINATMLPAEALAPQPEPLTAAFPASEHTSAFHIGTSATPQVVVAFNQPVVDFAETTPSLRVTGATVTSVRPHVVAGAAAHAYLVTLTPAGDDAIMFTVEVNHACADGGICTANGTPLSEVPAVAQTIPGPVAVRFGTTRYAVNEGATAQVVVELDRAHGRPSAVTLPLVVESGSTAAASDYTVPAYVTFGPGETRQTVAVATHADSGIEGEETVVLGFGLLPAGVNPGETRQTTVTLTDRTAAAQFRLTLNPTTVVEGGSADITVSITNGVTFATDQTFTLSFGGSATQDMDYTVTATFLLQAGQLSGTTTLQVTDDADTESTETISVTAQHGSRQISGQTLTIPASDQPVTGTPQLTIRPERNPAKEAVGAAFIVTRTGARTARLTVAVEVTHSGRIPLVGSPPTQAIFPAGQENIILQVPTEDDSIVEGERETSTVSASILADTHDPPLYLRGSPATAQVTVEDDDVATFALTVPPTPVPEGSDAPVTVSITNGVTFATDQTFTLSFAGNAEQGGDYTVAATELTLTAGQTAVTASLTIVDDGVEEPAETVQLVVRQAGQEVGRATLTIAASADTKPPTLEQAELTRDGRRLRLTFTEPVAAAAHRWPPAAAFTVEAGPDAPPWAAVAVTG